MIKQRMLTGARLISPLMMGVIPLATSTGIYGVETGLTSTETVILSLFVFAGAAQIAMSDLIVQSAPLWIIVTTALLINLRFMVYSANLRNHYTQSPLYLKPFLSFFITDNVFAVTANQDKSKDLTYECLGAGILLWLCWQGFVWVGAQFGQLIPDYLSLEYSLQTMFIFFGITMMKSAQHVISAVVTVGVILFLYPIMPLGSGLMTAIIIGAISGIIAKRVTSHE